ncbi:MAG: type II toxin-antitoxin system Phd/YefM family antitoxin [Actinomycetota bacterium]
MTRPIMELMTEVSVYEAKTHLSRLLRRVAAGEEVVIARAGVPVARLVPVKRGRSREFGIDVGAFEVPEDFDAPLPEEILSEFEG